MLSIITHDNYQRSLQLPAILTNANSSSVIFASLFATSVLYMNHSLARISNVGSTRV